VEAKPGAEDPKGGEGHGELLGRCGREREARVGPEDHLSGAHVHRERSRSAAMHARLGKRSVERQREAG
jgi:hypothetical protein